MTAICIITCVALNAVHQTTSRLTWSLARDEALLFSSHLSKISPTLRVPVYALVVDGVFVLLLGIVYVASTNAFNAFIACTVIVAQISFAVPAALLLWRRRDPHYLPPNRAFWVPGWVGCAANVMTIAWAVIITIFFCFPAAFPVEGGNMSGFIFSFFFFLLRSFLLSSVASALGELLYYPVECC